MKFFTADLHLGHERIIGTEFSNRPFASIAEHDAHIIDQINAHVDTRDELFILGDFCWERPGHYRARIKCRTVHLLWGNHDKASYGKHFSTTDDVRMVKIGIDISGDKPVSIRAFCSHYAHAYWPSSHHGALHFYGHNHDMREDTLEAAFPGRRAVDVGVDTAKRLLGEYRPFSDLTLISMLQSRSGHDPVEWYRARRARNPP